MAEPSPIERAFFREAEDGSTVFFPWGLTHRGYRLPDEAAKAKAARRASVLMTAPMAIGVWAAHALQPLFEAEPPPAGEVLAALALPGAVLGLVLLAYAWWVSRFVEGLAESDLTVSRDDRLRQAAELASPRKVALIGAITVGLSLLLIGLDPRAWWLGLLGALTGLGLLWWSRLLDRVERGRT